MLDILGAIALTTLSLVGLGVLILRSPLDAAGRRRLGWIGGGWLAAIVALAALGVFSAPGGLGTPAVGLAVVAPLVAALVAYARSPAARSLALGIPLSVLVAVHVGRLLGALFLALHAAGRLPPTFALTAGWGDIAVAAFAAPLAWAIHRQAAGWRPLTLVWNAAGLLDLVTAVTLGVGSAPDSPARFIFEVPAAGTVAMLPWVLIPGFLVPLYLMTHLAIFAQLARRTAPANLESAARRRSMPGPAKQIAG